MEDPIYLLRRSVATRMFPMLADFAGALPALESAELTALNAVASEAQACLLAATARPIAALEENHVEFALLKGSSLIFSLYPKTLARFMADVDILVQSPDLKSAERAFIEEGFQQGFLDLNTLAVKPITPIERQEIIDSHYEAPALFKLVRVPQLEEYSSVINDFIPRDFVLTTGTTVYVVVQSDIHFNIGFDINIIDVWDNLCLFEAFGLNCRGLSIENQICFTAGRVYAETLSLHEPALRMFVDLLGLVASTSKIDWDQVCRKSERYNVNVPMYYCMSRICKIQEKLVPQAVVTHFTKIASDAAATERNQGDFFPKMIEAIDLTPCEI